MVWEVLGPIKAYWRWSKSDNNITFANGSQWWIRHLDQEGRSRGPNLDYVCVDEAAVGITKAAKDQMMARLRRGNWGSFNACTNADSKQHWIYREWYAEPTPDHTLTEMNTHENIMLPREYLADLDTRPDIWRKQFMLNEWGSLVGGIFSLTDGIHTNSDAPKGDARYYLAFDFGYVDDFVCLLCAIVDSRIHIVDEVNAVKTQFFQQQPLVQAMLRRNGNPELSGVTGDTADFAALRDWSVYFNVALHRTDKDRLRGWLKMLDYIEHMEAGAPMLTIHPRCRRTLESLRGLVWLEGKQDAAPGDDHNSDALRYIVMSAIVPRIPQWHHTRSTH